MTAIRERRIYRRFRFMLPIKYILYQQKLRFAHAIDFSLGGMRILNTEYLPTNTKALIEFLPPDWLTTVRVVTEIVHVHNNSFNDNFTLGLRFKSIVH